MRLFACCAVLSLALVTPHVSEAQSLTKTNAAPLVQSDLLMRNQGLALGGTVLDSMDGGRRWAGGFHYGGTADPSGLPGADLTGRGLAIGYTTGWLGLTPFIGYGQGESVSDDGIHSARIRGYALGLAMTGQTETLTYGVAAFISRIHNKVSSASPLTGEAEFDGQLIGLTARGSRVIWTDPAGRGALDLVVQGDVLQHRTEAARLTGTLGTLDERTTTAHALRIELGTPMERAGFALRPYLAYTAQGGQQDALANAVNQIDAPSLLDRDMVSLGLTFDSQAMAGLNGRIDLSGNGDDSQWAIRLGVSF